MPSLPAFVCSYVDPTLIPVRPQDRLVTVVGRSNVGKSSLINALAGTIISRTSRTPGRTQLLNLFQLTDRQYLLDLPGYGYAKHAKTSRDELETRIHDTIMAFSGPERPIWLITDSAVGLTDLDEEMLDFLRTEARPFVVIANKCDKLTQKERSAQEKSYRTSLLPSETLVFCSAKTKEGLASLRQQLAA